MRNPDFLVFDEPTSSVDKDNAELILKSLWAIHREKSKIILVVSHDHELIKDFDKIIELDNGRIRLNDDISKRQTRKKRAALKEIPARGSKI